MVERRPFRMLFETSLQLETGRPALIAQTLESDGIETIHSSSQARLSKYHGGSEQDRAHQIFVVDRYDFKSQPYPSVKPRRYSHVIKYPPH